MMTSSTFIAPPHTMTAATTLPLLNFRCYEHTTAPLYKILCTLPNGCYAAKRVELFFDIFRFPP